MILWEDAFVARFRKQYGDDPRELPEDDTRVRTLKADIVTQFVAKVRTMLDEERARRGTDHRLKLAVATFATEADNRQHGLDVQRWVDEALVDQIGLAWFANHTSGLKRRNADIEYYTRIAKGTDTKVFPFLIGWRLNSPESILEAATKFYQHDIEGIVVWDPKEYQRFRDAEGGYWPILSRLGHVDALRRGELNLVTTTIPLIRLGQNHYSRWFPNTGF